MKHILIGFLISLAILAALLTFVILVAAPEVAYQQVTIDDTTFVYPGGAGEIILVLESGSYTVNGDLADGCYELRMPRFYQLHGNARLVGATCEEVSE